MQSPKRLSEIIPQSPKRLALISSPRKSSPQRLSEIIPQSPKRLSEIIPHSPKRLALISSPRKSSPQRLSDNGMVNFPERVPSGDIPSSLIEISSAISQKLQKYTHTDYVSKMIDMRFDLYDAMKDKDIIGCASDIKLLFPNWNILDKPDGKGHYGLVWFVEKDKKLFALKSVDFTSFQWSYIRSEALFNYVANEFVREGICPNIPLLFQTEICLQRPKCNAFFIQEMANSGTLKRFILSKKLFLPTDHKSSSRLSSPTDHKSSSRLSSPTDHKSGSRLSSPIDHKSSSRLSSPTWLNQSMQSSHGIYGLCIQTLFGIYTLNKNGIYHNDCHDDNIFLNKHYENFKKSIISICIDHSGFF